MNLEGRSLDVGRALFACNTLAMPALAHLRAVASDPIPRSDLTPQAFVAASFFRKLVPLRDAALRIVERNQFAIRGNPAVA